MLQIAKQRPIIFRRLRIVVEKARAKYDLRVFGIDTNYRQPRNYSAVALGPDVEDPQFPALTAACNLLAHEHARCEDRIITICGHMKTRELLFHIFRRPRRIRKQDHRTVLDPESPKRLNRFAVCMRSVMHHAPHIAEQRIVIAGNVAQAAQNDGRYRGRRTGVQIHR